MEHTIPPVFNENSKVLVLGSFPSPKSRRELYAIKCRAKPICSYIKTLTMGYHLTALRCIRQIWTKKCLFRKKGLLWYLNRSIINQLTKM